MWKTNDSNTTSAKKYFFTLGCKKIQILFHKYHRQKVSLQCVVVYAQSFYHWLWKFCDKFCICKAFYLCGIFHDLSSDLFSGNSWYKVHTKKDFYMCEYIYYEVSRPLFPSAHTVRWKINWNQDSPKMSEASWPVWYQQTLSMSFCFE
jgi:hypothetical protein